MEIKMKKKNTIYSMTQIALCAAILCILGPIKFPIAISPVPISLGVLGVYLAVYTSGWIKGTISVLIYVLLGLVGVPVFAGYVGGAGVLFGPTGGYIIGYLFLSLIAGFFIVKFENKIAMHVVGMVLGTLVCYALGTLWLGFQLNLGFIEALWAGVIPYTPADAVKLIITLAIGIPVRKGLKRANLL